MRVVVVLVLLCCCSSYNSLPSRARQNSKRLLIQEAPSMEAYSAKPDRRGEKNAKTVQFKTKKGPL